MFRINEKLKYMFLGGLLAFVGCMFGNMNGDTEAEPGSEKIDKLTVRELTVLENITVVGDDGERRVVISSDENGGKVTCLDPEGIRAAGLSNGEMGGMVAVTDGKGGGASLSVDEEGGAVAIFPVNGKKGGAALSIIEGDGVIITIDRFGEFHSFEQ